MLDNLEKIYNEIKTLSIEILAQTAGEARGKVLAIRIIQDIIRVSFEFLYFSAVHHKASLKAKENYQSFLG